jgi:hypothetical protein
MHKKTNPRGLIKGGSLHVNSTLRSSVDNGIKDSNDELAEKSQDYKTSR